MSEIMTAMMNRVLGSCCDLGCGYEIVHRRSFIAFSLFRIVSAFLGT